MVIISTVIALIIVLLVYNYVFNIYETDFRVSSQVLYADGKSTLFIKAVPLNGMGFKAPFRSVPTVYTIEEGSDLVEVVTNDEANGVLVIRAKLNAGNVTIRAKSKYALLPSVFEIAIVANTAQSTHQGASPLQVQG